MNGIKRKAKWNKHGVSEIIANILVLGITVTLFSSIMVFVAGMPMPQQGVTGDFTASLVKNPVDGIYNVTITHDTGPVLKESDDKIYLTVDGTLKVLNISDDPTMGNTWPIGSTWTYADEDITDSSIASVMIIDRPTNSLIWSDNLRDLGGTSQLVIMETWMQVYQGGEWEDSGSVLETQEILLFAHVYDPDGRQLNVTANLTDLGIPTILTGNRAFLTDTNGDGIFVTKETLTVPVLDLNDNDNAGSKEIVFVASKAGASTSKRMEVRVLDYSAFPPTIMYAGIEPSTTDLGGTFTVRCYVTDPNNNLNKSAITVSSNDDLNTLGAANTTHAYAGDMTYPSGQDPSDLFANDDRFVAVAKGQDLEVTAWITPADMEAHGNALITIVLKARYYTSDNYSIVDNPARANVTSEAGMDILSYPTPVTRVYNLKSLLIDTANEIQIQKITFENRNNGTVYFDYWWIETTYADKALDSTAVMKESSSNSGYFTAIGGANYTLPNNAVSGTYFYTISARDLTGNEVQVTVSHTVITSEIIYNNGGGGGASGEPPGNLNYSGLQGFNIFEWTDWEDENYTATPTSHFTHGQIAVVVVASKYLVNLANENTILVMNPTSKVVMTGVSSLPSINPVNFFIRYDFNAGYYVYNCSIDTGLIPDDSAYLVQMQLRDSWIPNNVFFATTTITVGSGFEPQFLTFKDPGFSVSSETFTTNEKIYVEIRNQDGGPWVQYGGDVEIRDFFWNAQIKRNPPSSPTAPDTAYNGPVSNLWQVSPPNGNVYRFVINLQNNTQGSPWLPGSNSYALRYDMFRAGSETYILSKIISISSPKWVSDIVAAGDSNGNGRFATYYSLFFYKNDNQWSPPDYLELSGDKQSYQSNNNIVRTGDMDGDGKNDFVTVRQIVKPNSLQAIYLDLWLNRGSSWVKTIIATLPSVPSCMALGNLDLDNDLDIAIGYGNGAQSNIVVIFRNDGLWTSSIVGAANAYGTVAIKMADMDWATTVGNDPLRSMDIVVARSNGMITIYKNQLGTGVSWTTFSAAGTTAEVFDWISSDHSVYGTVIGSYLNTEYPSHDDGIYQQITEEYVIQSANEAPASDDPTVDTVPDPVTNLEPGDELDPYTVLPGLVANINEWDSTNLIDTHPPSTAVFKIRYKTDPGYASGDRIYWWEHVGASWIPHEMFQIADTGGAYVEMEFDLKPSFPAITTTLADLNVTFANTGDKNVDFDYWTINVTYIMGDRLEHVWQMNLRAGSSHSLTLYALRSALNEADTMKLAYSQDNVTFTDLATITDETLPMTPPITATIPNTISGNIYLKVYDTVRSSNNPVRDWVRIGQLTVKTTASVASIGTKALAIDVADINGDGSNDIAAIEQSAGNIGQVWVCYNSLAGIFSSPVKVAQSASYYTANSVGIGRFLGATTDTLLDIMLATPGQVYILQNTAGAFAQAVMPSFFTQSTIVKALAGDVDGNQYTDILIMTTTGQIILFSDYTGTTTGWQRWLVDNLGGTGTDLDLGRLQN